MKNIISKEGDKKAHLWRICPIGKHFVKKHIIHIRPSKKHPKADNPSHKDELTSNEIKYISETYFKTLEGPPTAGLLTRIFKEADNFDLKIRGWVKYWNDVLQPDILLDANLIKALIGTESSFQKNLQKFAMLMDSCKSKTRHF
ncbi:MAG: hypothetical protein ACYCQI_01360 [Gammaproteobacteria bacterium]